MVQQELSNKVQGPLSLVQLEHWYMLLRTGLNYIISLWRLEKLSTSWTSQIFETLKVVKLQVKQKFTQSFERRSFGLIFIIWIPEHGLFVFFLGGGRGVHVMALQESPHSQSFLFSFG